VVINPKSAYVAAQRTFSRRRLYQALAVPGVADVTPVYSSLAPWKNPWTGNSREIFVLGVDPDAEVLDVAAVNAQRHLVRVRDQVLFDRAARPEFGPVVAEVEAGKTVHAEVLGHRVAGPALFPLRAPFPTHAPL